MLFPLALIIYIHSTYQLYTLGTNNTDKKAYVLFVDMITVV